MVSRKPFYLLVALLYIVGLGMTFYHHIALDVPLTPGEKRQIWSIEAKLEFEATGEPVSLVLSRSDQRLIALENGREIGRARIVVPPSATPRGTHGYVVGTDTMPAHVDGVPEGRMPQWQAIAVPGRETDAGRMLDPALLAGVQVPPGATERGFGIHGGHGETSLLMHLRPELVDASAFVRAVPDAIVDFTRIGFAGRPVQFGWCSDDFASGGVIGDPSTASAADGELLAAQLVADGVATIRAPRATA